MATHWVDEEGKKHKLTHSFKAFYNYRLDQYKGFTRKGQQYKESNQRVADILGLSYDAVKGFAKLARDMGLIVCHDAKSPRNSWYTVFDISYVKGYLINDKLPKHLGKQTSKKQDEGITWEELKVVEANKRMIDTIRRNTTTDWCLITKEQMKELLEKLDQVETAKPTK